MWHVFTKFNKLCFWVSSVSKKLGSSLRYQSAAFKKWGRVRTKNHSIFSFCWKPVSPKTEQRLLKLTIFDLDSQNSPMFFDLASSTKFSVSNILLTKDYLNEEFFNLNLASYSKKVFSERTKRCFHCWRFPISHKVFY